MEIWDQGFVGIDLAISILAVSCFRGSGSAGDEAADEATDEAGDETGALVLDRLSLRLLHVTQALT